MKIIIVGAGIGGLSAYLALKKHLTALTTLSITLVEAYPSPSQHVYSLLGNGLGLAPNGLRAIDSITSGAVPHIYAHGYTKGSSMTFRNAKGKHLGTMGLGMEQRYGYSMTMLPRAVVHEALLKEVDAKDIKWGIRVVAVREFDDGEGGIIVQYEDGTEQAADLVIGADGVRSFVKRSLFNGDYEAQYEYVALLHQLSNFSLYDSGLTGLGAFLPVSSLPSALQQSLHTEGVTMTFGKNGFFGYSLCSPFPPSTTSTLEPFIQWWSIFETDTIPEKKDIDYEEVKAQLLRRHGDWISPYDHNPQEASNNQKHQGIFRTIIELTFETTPASSIPKNVLILPRFITPRLPAWSNATHTSPVAKTNPKNQGRIVLIGDAAHTMPPDVGQGVSCAAEDSVAYALLLKHFISQSGDAGSDIPSVLKKTAEAYEIVRKPRIHAILDQAKYNASLKKEMGSFAAWMRDSAMWILCKSSFFSTLDSTYLPIQVNCPRASMIPCFLMMRRSSWRTL